MKVTFTFVLIFFSRRKFAEEKIEGTNEGAKKRGKCKSQVHIYILQTHTHTDQREGRSRK